MRSYSHASQRSRSRGAAVGRGSRIQFATPEERAAWKALIERAQTVTAAVQNGEALDRLVGAEFAGLVVRMKARFPVPYPSAQNAAEAFLVLARGFVASHWPRSTADFLAAGAAALDAMLIEDGHAKAAISRRICGGDD